MSEVEYKISTHIGNSDGYQSKKGAKGEIKVFVSNVWKKTEKWAKDSNHDPFDIFVDYFNSIFIHERYCIERAFQKIRIKGGMCNPCCVVGLVDYTIEYLFKIRFEGGTLE